MSYRQFLRQAGRWFLPLGFLARLPYAMLSLSTLTLLQSATGSYAFAGAAAAAQSLAIAAGGPVVGRVAQRRGLRRVAAFTAVVNAAAIAVLVAAAASAGRTAMLVAAILVGLTQPQVGSMTRIHWSYRTRRSTNGGTLRTTALSYEAAADETSFVAGPALVGLLAAIATPVPAAAPPVAAAVLLLLAALPLAALYAEPPAAHREHADAAGRLPVAPLVTMVFAMALMGAIFGVLQTGVTSYAREMHAPGNAGLLYAELGLGSALTGLAYAKLPHRFGPRARYRAFAAVLLAGTAVLSAGGTLLAMPAAMLLAGVTVAPYLISLYILTEGLAPARVATAMTVVGAGGPVGTAAGQVVAGALVDAYGYRAALAASPALAGAALLLALAPVRWPGAVGRTPGSGDEPAARSATRAAPG